MACDSWSSRADRLNFRDWEGDKSAEAFQFTIKKRERGRVPKIDWHRKSGSRDSIPQRQTWLVRYNDSGCRNGHQASAISVRMALDK